MNRAFHFLPGVAVAIALVMTPAQLHSEGADAGVPKTPLQQLIELKASNDALLKQQQQTLQKLEELRVLADQLRTFSKRS